MTEMIIDILGPAHLATAEALCGMMLERGVTPAQLLAAIRQHNARAVAAMAAQAATAARQPPAQAGQQGNTPRRTRAGDRAEVAGACPACGGTLELVQLCPQASPHWRTQAACMAEHCTWHGLSTEPISWLLAHKLQGLEAG